MQMLWGLLCFLFLFDKGTFPRIPQIDFLIIFRLLVCLHVHTFRSSRIGLAIQEIYWGLGTGVGEGRGEASGGLGRISDSSPRKVGPSTWGVLKPQSSVESSISLNRPALLIPLHPSARKESPGSEGWVDLWIQRGSQWDHWSMMFSTRGSEGYLFMVA